MRAQFLQTRILHIFRASLGQDQTKSFFCAPYFKMSCIMNSQYYLKNPYISKICKGRATQSKTSAHSLQTKINTFFATVRWVLFLSNQPTRLIMIDHGFICSICIKILFLSKISSMHMALKQMCAQYLQTQILHIFGAPSEQELGKSFFCAPLSEMSWVIND